MAAHPYNIILAGKYGVGKSTIFRYLSQEQGATQKSVRSWDKWEHVMSVGKDEVQVVLWDTANMEVTNITSMSRSYFTQCVGVILIYQKGDTSSLFEVKKWVSRAHQESEWCGSLVLSLWSHDMGTNSDEVSPELRDSLIDTIEIPRELVFDVNVAEEDGNVRESYWQVVAAVHKKWTSPPLASLPGQFHVSNGPGNKAPTEAPFQPAHISNRPGNEAIPPPTETPSHPARDNIVLAPTENEGNIQQASPSPHKGGCFC